VSTATELTAVPPLPDLTDALLAGYWDAVARGELVVRECRGCGAAQWPPRAGCGRCGSVDLGWRRVAGTGTLFTWTTVHHTTIDYYKPLTPFALAAVELDDAPVRMLGRVRGTDPEELRIDLPLRVVFEPVAEGVRLPVWEVVPA
jgi:uncharacterized OB-fold protein